MFENLQDQLNNPVRKAAHAQGTTVPIVTEDGFSEPRFHGKDLKITVGRGWLIENLDEEPKEKK